jgi:outer membrane protein, heavy metal efflux system
LPIFNQGQARQAQTKSMKALSQARLHEAELAVENSIQTHVNVLQMQREAVSAFREALIPQREKILQRSQQAQNFMLIGVFELIQAKAKEYDAYQGYLEAIRDYWQTRISLTRIVGERLPSDAGIRDSAPTVKEILGPVQAMPHAHHHHHDMSAEEPKPEMDHSGHDMPKTEDGEGDSQPKDKAEDEHHHKGVQP